MKAWKWKTVCAKAEALYFFGSHSVKETVDWNPNYISEQVVESTDLRRQTKECMTVFFLNVWEMLSKKLYCVISLQDRKVKKKLQLHNIKVSSTTVWRYMINKGWKALKRKRRRTCRHGVRRIWKLYSKGRPASKLTWCEPSGDHLDYRWPENIQRTNPKITGRAKAVTTLRLEKCVCRHTLGARTFYTSPLRKCQKT